MDCASFAQNWFAQLSAISAFGNHCVFVNFVRIILSALNRLFSSFNHCTLFIIYKIINNNICSKIFFYLTVLWSSHFSFSYAQTNKHKNVRDIFVFVSEQISLPIPQKMEKLIFYWTFGIFLLIGASRWTLSIVPTNDNGRHKKS